MNNPNSRLKSDAVLMCFLGVIFYAYEYYLRVAPSVMAPELKQAFGLTEVAFGHLCAFYYYAYTPMQLPVGVILDWYGVRRVLSIGCLSCAFGAYLFSQTMYLGTAQFARLLIGFGSAFAYVGVLKISDLWLPKKYFALMAGVCSTLGMLVGATGGQLMMTKLVECFGFRETLEYAAYVGILLTLCLWGALRDKAVTTSAAAHRDEDAFLFESMKAIIASPQIWITGLIGCLTFLPISGFAETWTVSFLTAVGLSKTQAAFGSSMLFVGFAAGGPFWGIVSDWMHSRRLPLMIGSFLSAVCIAMAIFLPRNSVTWMGGLLFLTSFFASAEILVFAVANDLSRSKVSATAVAFINMFTMVGGMLLPPLIGYFLDHERLGQALTIQDYSNALSLIPMALATAGVLSLLLKDSYHKRTGRGDRI